MKSIIKMKRCFTAIAFFSIVLFGIGPLFAQGWIDDGTVVRLETSTDSVGVGTTTPGAKLHVSGGDILLDNNKFLSGKDSTGTARRMIYMDSSNHTNIWAGNGGFIRFMDSLGAERVTFYMDTGTINAGDIITKGPWVDVRAYTSFSAAIDAIGTSEKNLLIPNQQNVTANKTVPSNVTLSFLEGGYLNISSGITVTINGPIDADLYRIFNGGTVSFGSGYVKEVYPQWWGAKGDGTTDDKSAIQAAIDSGCKRIFFPKPSVAYRLDSGLTIGASVSTLNLVGQSYGNAELRYTPTTGNGVTFNGEADNFTMKDIYLASPNSSSGTGIFSNNLGTQPLRDFLFENVSVSGFLKGIIIQGGLNGKIKGGRQSGQGKTSAGGIGIQYGEDSSHSFNHGLIEDVYVSSYETGVINKYCGPMHIEDSLIGFSSVGLKNVASNITYVENLYIDSYNDTAIQNDGYLYYSSVASSAGTQAITTSTHRVFKTGYDLARVNVYRNTTNQSIPTGTATKVQFNAEREDWEGYFDSTTNYRFTAPFHGYYHIDAVVQWRAGTTDKEYKTWIYRNGTMLTENIAYSRGGVPYYFTTDSSTMVWLDKNDYIEVYVQHNEGVNSELILGDGKTYLAVVSQ